MTISAQVSLSDLPKTQERKSNTRERSQGQLENDLVSLYVLQTHPRYFFFLILLRSEIWQESGVGHPTQPKGPRRTSDDDITLKSHLGAHGQWVSIVGEILSSPTNIFPCCIVGYEGGCHLPVTWAAVLGSSIWELNVLFLSKLRNNSWNRGGCTVKVALGVP
jgi:hypothetical protein